MNESVISHEAVTSTLSEDTVTLGRHTIEYVMEALDDELETLYALDTSLCIQIGEPDRANPKDGDNMTAFKLAQLLEDRLGSTRFREAIGTLLRVKY